MQITHMTPSHSGTELKNNSPLKRPSTPNAIINATNETFVATNSPRQREIDQKLITLREESLRRLAAKQTSRENLKISDGFVKTQVGEIERKTPPKTRERSESAASPRTPVSEGRKTYMGISKLNSAEKKGCLIPQARAANAAPPVPRKDSVALPPDSPKNSPLPPTPGNAISVISPEPAFGLISGKALIEQKKSQEAGSLIKLREKPTLERGDNSSLRNIREKISRITTPSTLRTIKSPNVFIDFIKNLNEVMLEEYEIKDDDGTRKKLKYRQSKYVLITNSEDKLEWISQESEPHLKDYILKGSKSTLISTLKILKSASKAIKNNPVVLSDINQNIDRLLQNSTVRELYDAHSDVRKRIHKIHFSMVYEQPYNHGKLIRNLLVLSEYNIRLMYEFLADEQERTINKFKELYPNPPTSSIAADCLIERLNQTEICALQDKSKGENITFVRELYNNPRAVAFNNHLQKPIFDIKKFLDRAFEACSQFRKNLTYIDDLGGAIEKMPEEKVEKGFLTTKERARAFLNEYKIDSCITEIMRKQSDQLKEMVAGVPHAIRDLYKRTVTLLEEQGKIQKFDTATYFDRINNQTKFINDQTLERIPGTINEIAKYLPKKPIKIADRSQKHRKK